MAEDLGERIREMRARTGVSAADLARRVDVGYTTLYRIEKGQTDPSYKVVSDIAHALGLTTSELLGERETVVLSEPPAMGLARRAAASLGALALDDPVEFLLELASLSEDDQAEIADLVKLKLSRARRKKAFQKTNGITIMGGIEPQADEPP